MSVHVVEQGADLPSGASDGDVVLRRKGEEVEVARVQNGTAEWLGSVPASTLPLDGDAAQLEIAAHGVESALVERGG